MAEAHQTRGRAPSARAIAEGALFADLTVIVILLGLYVPYAGPILATISPLPLLLLVLRQGWRVSAQAAVVATFLVSFLTGPLTAIAIGFVAVRAVSLGIGMRRNWRVTATILVGTTVLWAVLYTWIVGTSLLVPPWRAATEQGFRITYDEVAAVLGSVAHLLGQDALWRNVHPELNRFFHWFLAHWLLVLPLLAWPVLVVGVTAEYVIAEAILPRFGFTPRPLRLPFQGYLEQRNRENRAKMAATSAQRDSTATGGDADRAAPGAEGGDPTTSRSSNPTVHRVALPVEERVRE